MLTHSEYRVLSIKTFVDLKCNIETDLDFYVRVRACVKRVTGKQPLRFFRRVSPLYSTLCRSVNSKKTGTITWPPSLKPN